MEKVQHLKIPLEEINLATNNFSDENFIARGGFGKVYIGTLTKSGQKITVAVKRLESKGGQGYREFMMEIQTLACYGHKNLISLIGFCEESGENIIVYEHAKHGSLDKYLSDDKLSWMQRLKISLGAARGFNYLHNEVGPQHRIIHRDIKSSNILLNENWEAKISDFGLSKISPSNVAFTFLVTNTCGTIGYIDPEYFKRGILTKESDVYSFGVMLFELLCGRRAFFDTCQDECWLLGPLAQQSYEQNRLQELILPGIKNDIKVESLNIFSRVAYECLKENHSERPTMSWIVGKLEEALGHQEDMNELIECVSQDIGFSHGKPVAAFTIYKWLIHWKSLEAEKTSVFDRLIQLLGSVIKGFRSSPSATLEEDINELIECVSQDIGFSHGKPVAAFTIYKWLIHWKSLEAEKTSVFDRLIQLLGSVIKDEDNNKKMAYWFTNTCTLLFLLQESTKPPPQTSLFEKMTRGFRSSPSATLEVVSHVEVKLPALLFKKQLTAYTEKMYVIIRDNFKKELSHFLTLCIEAPRSIFQAPRRFKVVLPSDNWRRLIDCLNTHLNTMNENFVPPIIRQRILTQIFSYINVNLFNSVLLHRECCTSTNGKYVKGGLAELETWCSEKKEEYVGSTWDELMHTRQAIGFLVNPQKFRISYDQIFNDLCPILSVQQVYRIFTQYWDNEFGTRSVSPDIISRLRILMTEKPENVGPVLLKDNSSILLPMDDLYISMQVKEFRCETCGGTY